MSAVEISDPIIHGLRFVGQVVSAAVAAAVLLVIIIAIAKRVRGAK